MAPAGRLERAQLVALAVATLVPFTLLAIWAATLSPAPWEPGLLVTLATGPGLVGDFSGAVNSIGNLPIWAAVIGVTSLAIGMTRGLRAAALVALSLASDLAAFGVKVVVERERPQTSVVQQFFGADNFSYPSGHTVRAAAFVAATVFVLAPARWRVPLALLGGLIAGAVMGYARVSLGVHWPTDTLGGTLLGLGWFAVTALLLAPRAQRPDLNSRR